MPLSVYQERAMLELLFVIGFFVVLLATGVSLLGILAALLVATAVMGAFCVDDQAVALVITGGCGGVDYPGSQNAKNSSISAQ
jgi:hypothetical protein